MDINQVTITGKVMQNVTTSSDKDGVVTKLGTVGIYKGNNKKTNKPLYANIPFVAYNTATKFITPNTRMMLVGCLNSYVKQDDSQYGKLIVQLQVNSAYPIATPDKQAYTDADTGIGMNNLDDALDTLDFDKFTNQLNGASK